MKIRVSCLVLLCSILLSCNDYTKNILLKTPNGSTLKLELALDQEARTKGLMFRKHLPKDSGMLFVFEDNIARHFWMKNTEIPLSIAFINHKGKVLSIEDMKPLSLATVSSKSPTKYVIEVNQGAFADFGIKEGSVLAIPDNIVAR